MSDPLPFALPDLGDEEVNEVVDVLRSGWLTTGPRTKQLEKEFVEFLGGAPLQAIAVSSATAGLHLALEAAGIGPGDEVVTTTYTFTATAEAVRYVGADPKFVDVDPRTLNIDVEQAAAAIGPRTKAIIPVHFAGLACDMAPLIALAKKHGLAIIEDAAHAIPTTYQRRLVGSLDTTATVFSFYAAKPLAAGEGGMILTRDPKIADRCRLMRLHGINRDAFDRYTAPTAGWRYDVVECGYKYNLTDLSSAIALWQLRKIERLHAAREAMARRYREALAGLPLTLPEHAPSGERHAWHLYVVQVQDDSPITRDQLIERLAARGIGTSVHYVPLHFQPYWRDRYGLRAEDFPQATDLFDRVVSLPLYTRMTAADHDRVIEAVHQELGRKQTKSRAA